MKRISLGQWKSEETSDSNASSLSTSGIVFDIMVGLGPNKDQMNLMYYF